MNHTVLAGVDAKHVPAPPTQSRSEARKAIADALATYGTVVLVLGHFNNAWHRPESFEEYLHTVGLLDESKDQVSSLVYDCVCVRVC